MFPKRWTRAAINLIGAAGIVALAAFLAPARNGYGDDKPHDHHDHGGAGLKTKAPLDSIHLYLCAFHVAKENPKFQIEAHHFCSQHGRDVHQCLIYDSKENNSRLLGVEYIIPDEVYRKLPDTEKKYWHPHAYEILSGQLIAPDMPKLGDDVFPGLLTTWGKTWHTWPDPTTPVPMGEPLLMWSANGDGQVSDEIIKKRDDSFGISTKEIRDRRKAWGYEVPQIPPPKSKDELGRIWTPKGEDRPTRKTAADTKE